MKQYYEYNAEATHYVYDDGDVSRTFVADPDNRFFRQMQEEIEAGLAEIVPYESS